MNNINVIKIYFAFLFLFVCQLVFAQKVKVIGITDGDTFTAIFEGNKTERIRIHGIDCPEKGQPFSSVARKFVSDLIFGREVYLKQTDIDRYGRIVAIVYLADSSILNERLLQAGLAWHYTRYDNSPKWKKLEQDARQNKVGLWGGSETPIEPWNWRKLHQR